MADDGIATHEAALAIEHVHRAAHALAHAGGTAEQFRHYFTRRGTADQRMRVFAVIADDVVGRADSVEHAGGDRFLAGIEMQEANDIAFGIFLGCSFFEGARQQHVTQHVV